MGAGEAFSPGAFYRRVDARIEADLGGRLGADRRRWRGIAGPARTWRHAPSGRDAGFIAALTENFCETCTASGSPPPAAPPASRATKPSRCATSSSWRHRRRSEEAILASVIGKQSGHAFTTLAAAARARRWWPSVAKRAKLALSIAVVVGALGYLFYATVASGAEYYKHVDEVLANPSAWQGKRLQLHGYARDVHRAGTRDWSFGIEWKGRRIEASYAGIVPDTFKEGSEVVVKGRLREGGGFAGTEVIAMPVETRRPA